MKNIASISVSALTILTVLGLGSHAFAQDDSTIIQDEDVVIAVGTLIRRPAQADRASPVVSISDELLASTGPRNMADLRQSLTINTGSENNPDAFTRNAMTGTANIN